MSGTVYHHVVGSANHVSSVKAFGWFHLRLIILFILNTKILTYSTKIFPHSFSLLQWALLFISCALFLSFELVPTQMRNLLI